MARFGKKPLYRRAEDEPEIRAFLKKQPKGRRQDFCKLGLASGWRIHAVALPLQSVWHREHGVSDILEEARREVSCALWP
ncbi:hypothetical protein AFCDBAGC_2726 [Methylobacterium cerastii]|uniref:Uncharacterized protein n=1 Tax=Methylobacterium cerastii TaxID=932741 RepID=A0ABQ4QJ44_9HYPH|nr:hypothetical protein AFCDBAGC_2726 [Methylobacterium cerastii]